MEDAKFENPNKIYHKYNSPPTLCAIMKSQQLRHTEIDLKYFYISRTLESDG